MSSLYNKEEDNKSSLAKDNKEISRTTEIFCSSPIFEQIYKDISKSYPNCCLLYIEQIHNVNLVKAYENRKEKIKKERGFVNEMRLFHGTTEDAKCEIIKNGFDPKKNKNSAYGKGTYFHKEAMYSKDYCKPNNSIMTLSFMFICNVLIGKSKIGSRDEQIDTNIYDNLTNKDGSIIVTPYNDGAVPVYCAVFYKDAK